MKSSTEIQPLYWYGSEFQNLILLILKLQRSWFTTTGIVSQQLQTCNLLSPRLALSRFNLEKKSKCATDADTTVPSEATNSLKQLEHDNIFKEVSPGDFIALQIMQYREELTQIGKVVKLNESSVSVVRHFSGRKGEE